MNINKVVVTSQHPLNKHIYTTKLDNKRFDVNIKNKVVWESMRLSKRTGVHHNVIINNKALKQYILDGVNNFLNV